MGKTMLSQDKWLELEDFDVVKLYILMYEKQ